MSDGATTAFVLEGGWPLVLSRAIFVASLLSVSGCLAFRELVIPRAFAGIASMSVLPVERALSRLTWGSLAMALLGIIAWTLLEAGDISSAEDLGESLAAVPLVLAHTQYGHLVLLQIGLIAATAGSLAAGVRRLAAIPAGLNVITQAAHGHAMAMRGGISLLFGMDALHLLAAAVWIGGLLPLLLVVHLGSPKVGATAARRFSPIGKWSVVVLAGSAMIQSWVLVGSLTALGAMPYGWVVLAKTVLFDVLFGFALLNRYRLAPDLRDGADRARRRLTGSILVQAAFGLLAIAAAAMLTSLPPGMDMHMGMS